MSDPRLRVPEPQPDRLPSRMHNRMPRPLPDGPHRPIGRYLVDAGCISSRDLLRALALQQRWDAPLGGILLAQGLVSEEDVLEAVARQHGLHSVDLKDHPPDPELLTLLPPETWLAHRMVPWMRLGSTLLVATARPDRVDQLTGQIPGVDTVLAMVAHEDAVLDCIADCCADHLARRAEQRVAPEYSSRVWQDSSRRNLIRFSLAIVALIALAFLLPQVAALALCGLALITLVPVAGLKITAFCMQLFGRLHDPPQQATPPSEPDILPRISVLVPLFRETEIASTLIERLRRVRYPRALLDVILVLEEKDTVTRATLDQVDLPHWIRALEVPDTGPLTTKPRALNYALDFCSGDIVGVWDAEDAPAPDQLHAVAARFARVADDVVCLQGVLDYYNPRSNWLSRCFTIEYAGWWRVLLPGVARLGLVLPLGGTTLFFRRSALEELGAWDAHNVTEDADLGVRLARRGYRTELIETVTHEEANCRLVPWIKQRSRWLKGFMVTWLVHLRQPRRLLRELGWRRCLGFHTLMAGTVAQFALAPALWSLWLIPLGLPHPLADLVDSRALMVLAGICVVAELGNLAIGAAGVSGKAHRFLLPWVITMPFYSAIGAAAAFKALYELLWRPYFWDKTQHGHAAPDVTPADPGFPHPDADGS